MIDDADRTVVGYIFLWEVKLSGAKFLLLLNSCYHVVGRSSEVLLSKYDDVRMETVKGTNREYCVAVQGIDRIKTGTFQDVCIYPEKEYILYDWYRSMAYTRVLDNTKDKKKFPEFDNTVFKDGEPNIYSMASQMFRIV